LIDSAEQQFSLFIVPAVGFQKQPNWAQFQKWQAQNGHRSLRMGTSVAESTLGTNATTIVADQVSSGNPVGRPHPNTDAGTGIHRSPVLRQIA
jgi:hypothetical protein